MAEEIFNSILTDEVVGDFHTWLVNIFRTASDQCSIEEFSIYFLNFIRHQASEYITECVPASNAPAPNLAHIRNRNTSSGNPNRAVARGLFHQTDATNASFSNVTPFDAADMRTSFDSNNSSTPRSCYYSRSRVYNNSYSLDLSESFGSGACSPILGRSQNDSSLKLNLSSSFDTTGVTSSPFSLQLTSKSKPILVSSDFPKLGNRSKFKKSATASKQQQQQLPLDASSTSDSGAQTKRRITPTFVASSVSKSDFNSSAIFIEDDHDPSPVKAIIPDLTKVSNSDILNRLIDIYSAIIDLNLTINILSELSFLLKLLNSNVDRSETVEVPPQNDAHQRVEYSLRETSCVIFKNVNSCFYFSVGVLSKQKHCLAMLDTKTVKVLLENERLLLCCNVDFKDFLLRVYKHKMHVTSLKHPQNVAYKERGIVNVPYQPEHDTKHNFPSIREFTAFNKQRDMFYTILRVWESKHFMPSWSFVTELGSKIRLLFSIMEHPINMSHLAKLFTSQLILSCNSDVAASELQLALPKADIGKISKLQQRLIAPSDFSTDYLFPGVQAFFRDFLLLSDYNSTFVEQLKIILITELMELHQSSYEAFQLAPAENNEFKESGMHPEAIMTLKVLAKFLGLVLARPFAYEGLRSSHIDQKQVELRNNIVQIFDVKLILLKAVLDNKVPIVIPWIVQFMSMLDYVTLRLHYYTDVLFILYEVYIMSTDWKLISGPSSLFIVKLCLGWLFEQPNIPEEYYKYRRNRQQLPVRQDISNMLNGLEMVKIFVPASLLEYFSDSNICMTSYEHDTTQSLNCTLQKATPDTGGPVIEWASTVGGVDSSVSTVDPMLENVLNSACPFLADFRVSIMPMRPSKTVSRTGTFRHITTKLSDTPTITTTTTSSTSKRKPLTQHDAQTKLADAFLHSQSPSVRKTIEFIVERTVSAVIKDFQIEIMIPRKKSAIEKVNSIPIQDKRLIMQRIYDNFDEARNQLLLQWAELTPQWTHHRIQLALDALLPNETIQTVKDLCLNLTVRKCKLKITEWKIANIEGIDFFSKDISADADQLLRGCYVSQQMAVNNIKINQSKRSPADIFNQLQMEIHKSSLKPHLIGGSEVITFLGELEECLVAHTLPANMQKTAAFMVLQLLQLIIHNRSDLIDNEFIDRFIKLWQSKTLIDFAKPPPPPLVDSDLMYDEDTDENRDNAINFTTTKHNKTQNHFYIFADVISSNYLQLLTTSKLSNNGDSFDAWEIFLRQLLAAELITINILNDQYVRLLREEWPGVVLTRLSKILQSLMDACKNRNDESMLFMEMLSDFSRGMSSPMASPTSSQL